MTVSWHLPAPGRGGDSTRTGPARASRRPAHWAGHGEGAAVVVRPLPVCRRPCAERTGSACVPAAYVHLAGRRRRAATTALAALPAGDVRCARPPRRVGPADPCQGREAV